MYQFPDTTVLCNFAAVDEMPLLREYLGSNGRWVQSIEGELKKSLQVHSALGAIWRENWFEDPIILNRGDEPERVERFRRIHMGGLREKPTQHLGESESFVALTNRAALRGSVFLTDDHDAYRLFAKFDVQVADTLDVLRSLVGRSSISAVKGLEIARRMDSEDRNLRRPPSGLADLTR